MTEKTLNELKYATESHRKRLDSHGERIKANEIRASKQQTDLAVLKTKLNSLIWLGCMIVGLLLTSVVKQFIE